MEYLGTKETAGVAGSLALAAHPKQRAAGGLTLGAGASYYLLMASGDGDDAFAAIPSAAWYRFKPHHDVAVLTLEEAENDARAREVFARSPSRCARGQRSDLGLPLASFKRGGAAGGALRADDLAAVCNVVKKLISNSTLSSIMRLTRPRRA